MNEIIRKTKSRFKLKEKINGIFINSNLNEDKEIYTVSGKKIMDDKNKDLQYKKLNEEGKEWQIFMIEEIINKIIINKYNFVHYNSFQILKDILKVKR